MNAIRSFQTVARMQVSVTFAAYGVAESVSEVAFCGECSAYPALFITRSDAGGQFDGSFVCWRRIVPQ